MITKRDYINMILSHPSNITKKWKLYPMKRDELKDMWEMMSEDKTNEGDDLLYSEYEMDDDTDDHNKDNHTENDNENNNEKVINTKNNNINRDEHNRDTLYEFIQNNESFISVDELNDEIRKLKRLIRHKAKRNKSDKHINKIYDEADDKINKLLDKCDTCSKDDEENILLDLDEYITSLF
jgi:hypothetical protein